MRQIRKHALTMLRILGVYLFCLSESFAVDAKNGQGNMTVTPTSINAGSTTNFSFQFSTSGKRVFRPGSQATLVLPAGWSAPQTNDPSGQGFVSVVPVLSTSTATLDSIAGSGPWTLTISFSVSQSRAGFMMNYQRVVAPTNAGIYSFTTQSKQSGGVLTVLKSGGPSILVNNVYKTNSTTLLSSALNPCTYGDWVNFTATVVPAGPGTPTGTVTFKDGDVILGSVALDSQGQARISTNRFSVPDSPSWITAEYSGNLAFNPSVSSILLQNVNPLTLALSGLAASNKVYDGGTGTVLDTSHATLVGVLAADDVMLDSSVAMASFATPDVGMQKRVDVTGLALAGLDQDNYAFAPASVVSADILPASLVVQANDTNRLFGAPNPAFTATYSGFVAGEDPSVLSGAPSFSTTADAGSPIEGSPYLILVTNGNLKAKNYSFVFVPGRLTITSQNQTQRIIRILKLADGSVSLDCSGATRQTYLLQAASSISGTWTVISTNTTDSMGLMTCTNRAATNVQNYFYRTVLP